MTNHTTTKRIYTTRAIPDHKQSINKPCHTQYKNILSTHFDSCSFKSNICHIIRQICTYEASAYNHANNIQSYALVKSAIKKQCFKHVAK